MRMKTNSIALILNSPRKDGLLPVIEISEEMQVESTANIANKMTAQRRNFKTFLVPYHEIIGFQFL